MSLTRKVAPYVVQTLVSPGLRNLRRSVSEGRRRLARTPHRVLYFHDVEDPYSHLAAQILEPLLRRFAVELVPHLVGGPDLAPEPGMLEAYGRCDAARVAPHYGLDFPTGVGAPPADLVALARSLLAAAEPREFLDRVVPVGRALWAGDRLALDSLAQRSKPATSAEVERVLASSGARRKKLGHYSGAMFYYGGEWYWGVDRLSYLEERLQGLGLMRAPGSTGSLIPKPQVRAAPESSDTSVVLEYFPSLRSPYTAISMAQTFELPGRLGIELRIRPVLPMVMRGMEVPLSKQLYIMRDTKREAERMGTDFGFLSDPAGTPVERGFALYPFARENGREQEYLLSFARGVFAEGIDAGTEDGLRRIVERAGLSWEAAQSRRSDEGWREELEGNRQAMFRAGVWGVPSFRLSADDRHEEFAVWGQDRLWLVEHEIMRRLSRPGD